MSSQPKTDVPCSCKHDRDTEIEERVEAIAQKRARQVGRLCDRFRDLSEMIVEGLLTKEDVDELIKWLDDFMERKSQNGTA